MYGPRFYAGLFVNFRLSAKIVLLFCFFVVPLCNKSKKQQNNKTMQKQTASKTVNQVYKSIAVITAKLAVSGISKDSTNQQQGFKFRGIDDIYNALAPLLSEEQLVIIPRIISRSLKEVTTKSGGVLFYVTLEAEYDFISAIDGTIHTARVFGEAMDSGDKATNKAMSAAYKYLCLQTFCIPTDGATPDPDAQTHQVTGIQGIAQKDDKSEFSRAYNSAEEVKTVLSKARDLNHLADLYYANRNGIDGNESLLSEFRTKKAQLVP